MFRIRLPMRLVGSRPLGGLRFQGGPRPLGGLRFMNQEAKQPTQPTSQLTKEPTKGTKDRLWERLSEVEARFGDLLKNVYEREVGLRINFATLNAGMQLVKWELSALTAAAITICGVILYFVDKWDKHWPASVVAILVEKNEACAGYFTPSPIPSGSGSSPTY